MSLQYLLLLVVSALVGQTLGTLSQLESTYITIPDNSSARAFLQYYTSQPHIAGSIEDYNTAVYTKNKFIEFGLSASIVPLDVVLNYPLSRVVRLVDANGATLFQASLTEPAVPEDPTSNNSLSIPTFNGYSGSGNVTAKLIYANYGMIEDFMYLNASGISVSGAIVIVRYGGIFRGVKAMLAQKFGAVGLLIYSDPGDDGYARGPVYPEGPWRPEYGVQRGSVQFLPICPGNPANRIEACLGPEYANMSYVGTLIPSIPVQPLSWGDAYPLLQSLTGPVAPTNFWGKLNITYNIGGNSLVNLVLAQNYTNATIWNVVGTLSGLRSDENVVLGNHRDAWVFGATDPSSGTSAMLETARSLALLRNTTGWVPQRDIIFCSWDAEEYGLLGSTGWAEANGALIRSKTIAYINTDVGVNGPILTAGGTPSLNQLFLKVANDLPFPGNPTKTMGQMFGGDQLYVLGSGSDYTVFIDHLGIPSIDIGFDGSSSSGGVYHSVYDSFYWMENFGDPMFIFHQGLAQLLGVLIIRFVDAPYHPFNYTNYASQLNSYFALVSNTTAPVDFSPLQLAITNFSLASTAIDSQSACAVFNNCTVNLASLNARLRKTEQRFLLNAISNSSDGLPGRPWYKHLVQAPGIYQGYGSVIFPGITESLMGGNVALAQQQINKAAVSINDAAQALTLLSVTSKTFTGCYGQGIAAINLSPTGGFSPLQYSLDNKTWQLSPSLKNLQSGSYMVSVMDALGFTTFIPVTITTPPKLDVSVTVSGSIATAVATGGTGNYTYTWSNGQLTQSITVDDTIYTLAVRDSNGCEAGATLKLGSKSGNAGAIAGGVIGALAGVAIIVGIVYYLRKKRSRSYENL